MRLGRVIADYRWANRIGVRELAKEIGLSTSTLNRIELGDNTDADKLAAVLIWLFAKGDHRRSKSDAEKEGNDALP